MSCARSRTHDLLSRAHDIQFYEHNLLSRTHDMISIYTDPDNNKYFLD